MKNMKIGKITLSILCLAIVISSCKNDDNDVAITQEPTPPRDRAEVQLEDDVKIIEYLTTHYYNAEKFTNNVNANISDLIISTEALDDTYKVLYTDDNIDNDAVEVNTVTLFNVAYKFYTLKLNQGGGDAVNFSDAVRVNYIGSLLSNDNVFDSAVTPVVLNLIGDNIQTLGTITGWRKVMSMFNASQSFTDASDGNVTFNNHGVGVMFLPSGLAYFANPPSTDIPRYSPLIFKFDLLQTFETDFDNDGVPSHLEDVSNPKDGEFFVESDNMDNDDDTDNDGLPDYVDPDDDGDGVLTIDEDLNNDGDPTNDIGRNGIPNYLDPEETNSK